jgi:YfiH family protein
MKLETQPLGTLIETDLLQILLANRNAQLSSLQSLFPSVNFKRIKQTHGDRIVHTSPHAIDFANEADAHYTSDKGLGLCISTADCVPVFIYHHSPQWVMGIHAGWRGIENRIVPKSITALKRLGCAPESLKFFVGPHIQMPSFEVGHDVRDQLLKSIHNPETSFSQDIGPQKSKVDLAKILKTQLVESGVSLENCFFVVKNTVTDQDYHSYRRDRENSGRQLSFIALKK